MLLAEIGMLLRSTGLPRHDRRKLVRAIQSCARRAAKAPPVPVPGPIAVPAKSKSSLFATPQSSRGAVHANPSSPTLPHPAVGQPIPLLSPWPWRPVHPLLARTSKSSSSAAVAVYERLIYARPLAASPLRNAVLALLLGFVGGMFWLMPKPKMPDWWSHEEIGMASRIFGTFNNYLLLEAPPYLAVIGMTVSLYRVAMTTRIVTRLSQLRIVEEAQSGEEAKTKTTRTVLRMWTGRNALIPFSRPRELKVEDVKIEAFSAGRTTRKTAFLNLSILPHARKRFSYLDTRPFYMDYRDSKYLSELGEGDEVVLSLNRVEHVFGKVALEKES